MNVKIYSTVLIGILTTVLFLSYSIYFYLDHDIISNLGVEDGFFENLTFLGFFIAAILFFVIYFLKNNYYFLGLALLFFFGAGEEVSWGQRLFEFKSPSYMSNNNVQGEFNFHNLEIFNTNDMNDEPKSGISRYISVNYLYKYFCLLYGVLLPILFLRNNNVHMLVNKCRLPLPYLKYGIFFLLNWLFYKLFVLFVLEPNVSPFQYYDTLVEMNEFFSSFVFLIIAFDFFQRRESYGYEIGSTSRLFY